MCILHKYIWAKPKSEILGRVYRDSCGYRVGNEVFIQRRYQEGTCSRCGKTKTREISETKLSRQYVIEQGINV